MTKNSKINLEDFLIYKNCPHRYIFNNKEKIYTDSILFKIICDEMIANISADFFHNTLKTKDNYYYEYKNKLYSKLIKPTVYHEVRLDTIILNFLDKYVYNNRINITGLTTLESYAELGIEILARGNIIFKNIKTQASTIVIFSYTSYKSDYLTDDYYSACILKEGLLNRGIGSNILIHNLNYNTEIKYEDTYAHSNLLYTITRYITMMKNNVFFFNVSNYCDKCQYKENCAKEIKK